MIRPEWFQATGISQNSIPDSVGIPMRSQSGDPDDIQSRYIWLTKRGNATAQEIKSMIRHVMEHIPIAITSAYRPSGTHLYGAIDIAPAITLDPSYIGKEDAYSHNIGIDPRLYARPLLLHLLYDIAVVHPNLTMLVEDNHIHIHDYQNQGVPMSFPRASLVAQIAQRTAYKRSDYDEVDDSRLLASMEWLPLDHGVIDSVFQNREFVKRY